MTSPIIKRQRDRIFRLYHRVRMTWPVWYYLLNRASRARWEEQHINLNAVQKRIVSTLARDGIATAHISELFPDGTLFADLQRYTDERLKDQAIQQELDLPRVRAATDEEKYFMLFLWGGGGTLPELDITNPCIRFILDERILEITASYLGLAPKFQGFSLQSTLLVPPDAPPFRSQRWHRDPDDKKILKSFLYLSDVEEEGAGPFCYVKGSHYGGRWRTIFPQLPPQGRYPPLGAVEKIVPKNDEFIGLGRAGTIIFCDTSGLHRGGYSTTKRRLMLAAGFCSDASVFPRNYRMPETLPFEQLSPLAQYALEHV